MSVKLSDNEIGERLQRLRNLERLYPIARQRIEFLEKENRDLKEQVKALQSLVKLQSEVIEKLKLRIEELERMVFGRKKRDKHQNSEFGVCKDNQPNQEEQRTPQSYRRAVPKGEDVTNTKDWPITHCPDCKSPLSNFKVVVQYQEDIEFLKNALKRVEKQRIQTGFCTHCQKRVSLKPIRPQTVCLGENVKQFICYGNVVLRLSFEQTRSLLKDLADISVSSGY